MQDPLETVRQKCEETEHCVHARERLEACETRVGSRSETTEDCTEELFDFLHARDHCVSTTAYVFLWIYKGLYDALRFGKRNNLCANVIYVV